MPKSKCLWLPWHVRKITERQVGCTRTRENYRRQAYLSSIQHKNLTPYRFVADSTQMTSNTLIRGLWSKLRCRINLKLQPLGCILLHGFYVGWMIRKLVYNNSLSLSRNEVHTPKQRLFRGVHPHLRLFTLCMRTWNFDSWCGMAHQLTLHKFQVMRTL